MITLTYEDLLTIRSVLTERHKEMAATLGRVERMIEQEQSAKEPVPNAVSLAAIEEAKNWRSLPAYSSSREAFASVTDDDE